MDIHDFEGGFCVEGLKGTRKPCRAEKMFQAACEADTWIISKTDFFLSMYQFPAAFVEQIKETGKAAGYAGACWARFLWFDIDREDDLAAAMWDAGKLVEFLVSGISGGVNSRAVWDDEDDDDGQTTGGFVPDTESIQIYFSGAKGFHVGVPILVFGESASASEDFASTCKAVACEIARLAGVEIDVKVYDRVRLFRCPNTKHSKTELFKIPVSFRELTRKWDMNAILKRAKHPRRLVDSPTADADEVMFRGDVPEMPAATELWQRVCKPVQAEGEEEKDTDTRMPAGISSAMKHQMQTLPESGEQVPRLRRETLEFIRHGAEKGERATTLFNAAADCTRCELPRGAVFAVLVDAARECGLGIYEIERQIDAGIKEGKK